MRAVGLIGLAALISISHCSTIHADFPLLRSAFPISSLATISKTTSSSNHRSRSASATAAAKKNSTPHRATKVLVIGDQASELVQLVASTRRFAASAIASGFIIQETLDRNGREELSVTSLNGTKVLCGNGNSFEPAAFESVVVPALTTEGRLFIADGITKHLTAFSPPSLSALSALLRHPHSILLASLSDLLLSDPSSLASLPLQDNPAVCIVRTGGSSREKSPSPSLRAQSTVLIQYLTSLLALPPSNSPPETVMEEEEGGPAQEPRLFRGRSRSRGPRVAMDPHKPITRSFSPVEGARFLGREDNLRQRSAAASLETEVRRTRAQYDRRTRQLKSKALELTKVRRGIAEQTRRWHKAKAELDDHDQEQGLVVPVAAGVAGELEEEELSSDQDDTLDELERDAY